MDPDELFAMRSLLPVAKLIPKWIDAPICFFAGIYILLLYHGVIPFRKRKGITFEEWRQKFGSLIPFCAWSVIAFSIIRILGIVSW